jgi:TRAP-type C4-dicarboxylate transport system permease small subunit
VIRRFARAVELAAEAFCVVAFASVFLVFVWKIGMRYVAGSAVAWADEVSVVLFVWIVFIANGFVVEDRRQISFDLLYRHVGPGVQRGLALARVALVGGLFAVALPGSMDYIGFLWRERTPVLLWRLDIVYSCFGLFMVGVLVRLAARLVRLLGPGWREAL